MCSTSCSNGLITSQLLKLMEWFKICVALRDLVPFLQFKKREKPSWRSVTFVTLLKVTPLHGCFPRF